METPQAGVHGPTGQCLVHEIIAFDRQRLVVHAHGELARFVAVIRVCIGAHDVAASGLDVLSFSINPPISRTESLS